MIPPRPPRLQRDSRSSSLRRMSEGATPGQAAKTRFPSNRETSAHTLRDGNGMKIELDYTRASQVCKGFGDATLRGLHNLGCNSLPLGSRRPSPVRMKGMFAFLFDRRSGLKTSLVLAALALLLFGGGVLVGLNLRWSRDDLTAAVLAPPPLKSVLAEGA